MPRTVRFTVKDREGVSHAYDCTLHPATEGQKVMWQLVALCAAPLAGAVKGLLPLIDQVKGQGGLAGLLDSSTAIDQLKGGLASIDFAAIGEDVKRSLLTAPMEKLVEEVLSRTLRDDKPLATRGTFDDAYSGNYGELLSALWEVVKANRFLSLPGM